MTVAPTISAVFIVKDEEAVLASALESVRWADQVVVYDTGSTDGTVQIARGLADTVVEGHWDADFGAARNRAIEHATGEWVLVLDADEVFVGDPVNVRRRLADPESCLWTVVIESEVGDSGASTSIASVRLFRRADFHYAGALHEQVVPRRADVTVRIDGMPNATIRHSGYRADVVDDKDKRERNLAIARAELTAVEDDPEAPVTRVAITRANLARSLVLASHYTEGLELGAAVVDDADLPDGARTQLAEVMVDAAEILGDHAAVEGWLAVWRTADRSAVWALAREARVLALRGDARATLDVLDRLPTTTVDPTGRRFVKHEIAAVTVWAHVTAGDLRAAVRVVREAARAGYTSIAPHDLVRLFLGTGRDLTPLVDSLRGDAWRAYALWCVRAPGEESLHLLTAMADARPDDVTALLSGAALAPQLALEPLAEWAARVRRGGLGEHCPLVRVATDGDVEPVRRSLAAAMAVGIYGDDRALPALEDALGRVAPQDEAALLAQLDVLTPGLVVREASAVQV